MTKAFRHGDEWFQSLLVDDLDGQVVLGTLVQLTGQMLVLHGAKPCRVGQRYRCRLKLPSTVLDRSQICFDAICSESRPQPDGRQSNVFSALIADPADMDALEMLILKFALRTFYPAGAGSVS